MNRYFTKESICMANNHMKICPKLLTFREMQIKTKMRYYYISIRMIKIKNREPTKCWWGYGENGSLTHCWWRCNMLQPLWKTGWKFLLKKLNTELLYDPATALLGTYPRKMKTHVYTKTCTQMFIEALFLTTRTGISPDVFPEASS